VLKFALVFLLCFIPRLAYLWWATPGAPHALYFELSDSLLFSGVLGFEGHPSTAFEPLYPLFLAAARWLTGDTLAWVLVLQIAVASLGAVYFYRLCLLLADERTARIGVLLFSFYPYLVRQSVSIIEITVLATLLVATAFYFCRIAGARSAAVAGAAFGLTLLARMAVLPALVLGVAFLAYKGRRAQALVVALTAFLVALPMGLRNLQVDGSFLPTRSGDNLLAGNNRYADQVIPDYNIDLLIGYVRSLHEQKAPQVANAGEPQMDAFYRDKAIEWMLEEPLRALRLKLLNIAYFFHPRIVPYHPVDENTVLVFTADAGIRVDGSPARSALGEWLHAISYSVIFLAALAGMWLRRKQFGRDAILYLMLLGFIVVSSVFFPATRLRAPVEFVLMFFSACALARWSRRA
jgi:4-amino-4-deoxy-L-arabinose transferase-like glycosyltransferase